MVSRRPHRATMARGARQIDPAVQQGFRPWAFGVPAMLFLNHPDWLMRAQGRLARAGTAAVTAKTIACRAAVLLYRTSTPSCPRRRTRVLMVISLATTTVHPALRMGLSQQQAAGCPMEPEHAVSTVVICRWLACWRQSDKCGRRWHRICALRIFSSWLPGRPAHRRAVAPRPAHGLQLRQRSPPSP